MKKHLRFVAVAATLLGTACVEPRDHLPDAGSDVRGSGGTGGGGAGGGGRVAGAGGTAGGDAGGLIEAATARAAASVPPA
jgi:hypothetical protein